MTLENILISQALLLSGCITVTTSEFPPHPISDSCQQTLSKRPDPVRRGPSAWAFSALQARASGHSLRAFPQRALSFLHALTVFSRPGCPICACLPSSALQGPCRVPGSDQLCLLSLLSLHPRDCWLEGVLVFSGVFWKVPGVWARPSLLGRAAELDMAAGGGHWEWSYLQKLHVSSGGRHGGDGQRQNGHELLTGWLGSGCNVWALMMGSQD